MDDLLAFALGDLSGEFAAEAVLEALVHRGEELLDVETGEVAADLEEPVLDADLSIVVFDFDFWQC